MSSDEDKLPAQSKLDSLLEYYQYGRFDDAEKLAESIIEKFPNNQFSWKILGAILKQKGRISEAINANKKAVELLPQDAEAHSNLGVTLRDLGRLDESEVSHSQAIALNPNLSEAHANLGNTLQDLGRLDEAEASYRQAIALKPNLAITHNNLGKVLKELNRMEEAETSYRQAIALNPNLAEAHNNLGNILQKLIELKDSEVSYRQAILLKPDYVDAHYNLGNTLRVLGRLKEAEASQRQAIAIKSDYAEAHTNLGVILQELGKLKEAEASHRQAIAIKSDYAQAHSNLGIVLYGCGDVDAAIVSLQRASSIDPKSNYFSLILSVLHARKARANTEFNSENINNSSHNIGLPRKILMLNKLVEEEVVTYLCKIESLDLDKENDPSFGNTRGSSYSLFQDGHPIIKRLQEDLTKIIMEAVKSEIYIIASFFSIFGDGGGTARHNHLVSSDKDSILSLANQKYSLVYYLSVGDQECCEPGILKFYEPNEDILPHEGLITIFPADRDHSSVYSGNKDRIIVGVNFYSL